MKVVARGVQKRRAASLMKLIKTLRHLFSERGLPLCLKTFRAFLQLSFLYEPGGNAGLTLFYITANTIKTKVFCERAGNP